MGLGGFGRALAKHPARSGLNWALAILMFFVAVCLIVMWTASRVHAKDVMIILNDQEQTALRRVLDSATKSEGIQIAQITVYLLNKLNSAMEVVEHKDNSDQPKGQEPQK